MSEPKAFHKQKKNRSKEKQQAPETADEYQAGSFSKAGVELEEAGEKWRAGDAAKSMRFFTRAIDMYDRGLQRHPTSLDLAYNKARAQYTIATHPVLVRQLPGSLTSALEEALASHRYALRLDQDNADTLFNTAQALTSLAEEICKDDSRSDRPALELLVEALDLLRRCLALQEFRHVESQKQAEAFGASQDTSAGEDMFIEDPGRARKGSDAGSESEQWASIVEPVTKDTLLDTNLAQLSTLTTLCSILGTLPEAPVVPSLAWVEEYSSNLLNLQLPASIQDTDRGGEAGIAKAVFISAMLEAGFRREEIDAQTYRREREAAFGEMSSHTSPSTSFAMLMANVASLFAFNHALSELHSHQAGAAAAAAAAAAADLPSLRWNALATAISHLATASKNPDLASDDLAKTHLLRGDASLYQFQLSKAPTSHAPAVKNITALLKNAEVFYRNASRLLTKDKKNHHHNDDDNDDDGRDGCRILEAVAVLLMEHDTHAGRAQLETIAAKRGHQWLRDHLEQTVTDGLLSESDVLNTFGLNP